MPSSLITSFEQLPVTLNAANVAVALGISKTQAYTLFHRADFPTIRVGGRYLVPRNLFIEWMNTAASKGLVKSSTAEQSN